ncbi:MAG: LysR family transcriptional regulator [Paracoccus sp. (in: a-proteobacteria)]|nr:LysR family transcriptional regulator [Paracoccus sp. (in: a-proteobacteria)]
MDRLNWDDIRLFLALARQGTLSGAARELGIGLATISRRVARMEHALGLPLFLRHQNGYDLTDQGAALLPRAEAVELALHDMRQSAGTQTRISGVVRLATVETLVTSLVTPALAPLLAAHPGLNVEVRFAPATVNLHRHEADLALRLIRPERGNLRMRQLAQVGFGLYGAADGAPSARHVVWPDAASLTVLRDWSRAFGADDAPCYAVNTLYGQVAAVAAGIGRGVLPHFMARAAGLRLLADRLPGGAAMARPVLLVTHADLAASRRVSAVADALADHITARRAELELP